MFKVDVIIPVFNNAHFIHKSVESAQGQAEVERIIVIDDGSTDNTLAVLRDLELAFSKLEVHRHAGGVNRGIACSRNLGIRQAVSEWIAFLDSDDYYLPGRFQIASKVIEANPSADGVFEPVINKVLSEAGAQRFDRSESLHDKVIRVLPGTVPDLVFDAMYFGRGGVVHMNGLTLKRKLAIEVGLFDENLRIVDDSVFRLKVAYKGKLFGGSNEPVAVRTIHTTNNEPNIRPYDHYMKFNVLLDHLIAWGAPVKLKRTLIHRILFHYLRYKGSSGKIRRVAESLSFLISNPGILKHYFSV